MRRWEPARPLGGRQTGSPVKSSLAHELASAATSLNLDRHHAAHMAGISVGKRADVKSRPAKSHRLSVAFATERLARPLARNRLRDDLDAIALRAKRLEKHSLVEHGVRGVPGLTALRDEKLRKSRLHDPRSSVTRKGETTCKERPEGYQTKKHGGGGKAFVPWCETETRRVKK